MSSRSNQKTFMPQSAAIAPRAPEPHADPHSVLTQTIAALKPFQMYVDVCSETAGAELWMERDALCWPDSALLDELIARFTARGFAPNKKAASASLLLRIGWASGFQIASYLVCPRVPYLSDYALRFGDTGIERTAGERSAFRGGGRSGRCETASSPSAAMPDPRRPAHRLLQRNMPGPTSRATHCGRW